MTSTRAFGFAPTSRQALASVRHISSVRAFRRFGLSMVIVATWSRISKAISGALKAVS
jgi:hypothetical protein